MSAPINVGSEVQVKSGGLWVGSLSTDGGIKTGSFSSLPACNAATEGTFVFNSNINKVSLCANNA